MKRNKLPFVSALAVVILLLLTNYSYSQWTIAGAVSGVGTFPSISVVDQNTAWIAGGTAPTPAVFRTTNGGTTWTTIPTTGISLELYCVWGVDSSTAYVGDGGASGGAGGNAKFYKTTNSGVSWTTVGSTGGTGGFFNGVVFSRTMPTFGIAESDPPSGVGGAYYVSVTTDAGVTWTVTSPPGIAGAASAQNSLVVIDNLFYGFGLNAAPGRVYMTSDGGTTWNARTLGISSTNGFTSGFAMSDNKLNGIAALESSLPNISRTTNGGVTWTPVNIGAGFTGYCTCKWIPGTNTCYISANVGASGVVKKSTDAGVTWTSMTTSGLTAITYMEFVRAGTTVYGYAVTGNGAVLKLTETVTGITPVNSSVPSEFSLSQNYPNPFNPTTTINFSIPSASDVSLKIYDALGKEVETLVNEFRPAGNYSASFTASNGLTSGVYYYKITAGNFTDTKKLMLVK